MARTDAKEAMGVGGIVILTLLVVAALLAVFTFISLFSLTKDAYVSAYSTVSVLFDATGINVNSNLALIVPPGSKDFYEILSVLIVDGFAKIVVIGFILSFVMEFFIMADIQSRITSIKVRSLKNHVILCGYSGMAERIAKDLDGKKIRYAIVEWDKSKVESLRDIKKNVIGADFATDEALKEASIGNAKAVLFASENDFENLMGIVTARHLRKDIKIISTAKDEDDVLKMHRAGADICVVPEVLTGLELGSNLISNYKA